MDFFYNLNKRMADLAKKQTLAEDKGAKPDFLDMDKDGNKKEPMKKAVADKDSAKSGKMFGKKTDMDEGKFDVDNALGDIYNKAVGSPIGNAYNKIRAANYDRLANKNPNDPQAAARAQKSANIRTAVADKNKLNQWNQHMMASSPSDWSPELERQKKANVVAHYKESVAEADMEEGNEFSGELAQARAAGAKQFKVDGQSYPVKEGGTPMTPKQKSFAKLAPPANKITFADKIAGAKKEVDEMLGDVAAEAIKSAVGKKKEPRSKGTAFDPEVAKSMTATDPHPRYDVKDTGYSKRYTRKVQDEPTDDDEKSDAPKVKGRPKGSKRAIGAKGPTGKSKLMSKDAIKEVDMDPADHGEYDQEGESAKCDIKTIVRHAQALHKILGNDDNLPEWVQSKLAKIEGMMTSVDDYMQNQKDETEEEPIAEKAVSKKQQKFMGMVHAAQKGEQPASGAVAKVAKEMPKKAAKDFAATKHKGLPEKVKAKKEESVEETFEAPAEKKAKGGYNFGGGVYESLDRKFQQALTEGMNVSVNMSTGQDGQPSKNITISADGDDADRLADLLKMAGLGGNQEQSCGSEMVDENSPDWPTNTETSDDAMQYSGGLNGPKSTGQSTTPVLASQLRRQVSMEEGVKIEQSLFKLYNQYKLK